MMRGYDNNGRGLWPRTVGQKFAPASPASNGRRMTRSPTGAMCAEPQASPGLQYALHPQPQGCPMSGEDGNGSSSASRAAAGPTARIAGEAELTGRDRVIPTTCIEHQAGRPTLRLSFQIKVF